MSIKVGELHVTLGLDNAAFKAALNKSSSQFKATGQKMTTVGKNLTMKVTAPILAIGAAALLAGSKFDDSMAKVSAISGATGKDFEKLRNQAKDLGATTEFSASQAAEGMSFMALAGFEVNEIMAAMPAVLDLATAGQLDLASASDIVTDTMSAFGLSAEQAGMAADVLAKTSAVSNTSVRQLGEAMAFAAPNARAAGMSIQQTSVMLGVLADNGKKASSAGTNFNAILAALQKEGIKGALTLGKYSVAVFDSTGAMRGMGDIMKDVGAATADMTDKQRTSALATIFNRQALLGANIMLGAGAEKIDELTGKIDEYNGAAKTMADIMRDTLGGAGKELASMLEGLAIQLSDILKPIILNHIVPALKKFGALIKGLMEKFDKLSPSMKKVIGVVLAVVVAAGPLLMVLGGIMQLVPILIAGFGVLTGALGFLLSPVVLVVAAIGGLIAAFVIAYKRSETLREVIAKAFIAIKGVVVPIMLTVKKVLTETFDKIVSNVKLAMISIKISIGKAMSFIKKIISVASKIMKKDFKGAWADIGKDFDSSIKLQSPKFATAGKILGEIFGKNVGDGATEGFAANLKIGLVNPKSVTDSKATAGAGGGTSSGLSLAGPSKKDSVLQEKLNGELDILRNALATRKELEQQAYKDRIAALIQFHLSGDLSTDERNELAVRATVEHLANMATIEATSEEVQIALKAEQQAIKDEEEKVTTQKKLDDELAANEAKLERMKQQFLSEEDVANQSFDAQLEDLQTLQDSKKISDEEYAAWKTAAEEELESKVSEIRQRGLSALERFTALSFGNQAKTVANELSNITGSVAKENKAMFIANKAAGIANAIISAHAGIAKTLSAYPFPINVGLAAAHAASAFMQVRAIASATMAKGGVVTGPTNALIGEAGDEAVIPLNTSTLSGLGKQIAAHIEGSGKESANITFMLDSRVMARAVSQSLADDIYIKAGSGVV